MSDKRTLVYGVCNDNLVLLPEDLAKAIADDLEGIWNLKTFGDAQHLEPQVLMVPGLDEDDYDEVPTGRDSYEATLTSGYQNGDWPAPAATYALDFLPDDLRDIGEEVEPLGGLPILFIDPSTESDLVVALQKRGYAVRRDDELIVRIG